MYIYVASICRIRQSRAILTLWVTALSSTQTNTNYTSLLTSSGRQGLTFRSQSPRR